MDTSKGSSMLVMPPGITTHSVLMDLKTHLKSAYSEKKQHDIALHCHWLQEQSDSPREDNDL
ncbi:hypothetical protein P5673_019016 [Acropora cervicornis]|uniref:Uncharacterized protein n=1 Tax=Acropora cervicornis TaxID=6130 RepID=A0AAD9QDA8_ACRCE|nr:hypothetical protein P5673_019016 [Acropora cervicornis]